MLTSSRMSGERLRVVTPTVLTTAGSRGKARLTRFCTSTEAKMGRSTKKRANTAHLPGVPGQPRAASAKGVGQDSNPVGSARQDWNPVPQQIRALVEGRSPDRPPTRYRSPLFFSFGAAG